MFNDAKSRAKKMTGPDMRFMGENGKGNQKRKKHKKTKNSGY